MQHPGLILEGLHAADAAADHGAGALAAQLFFAQAAVLHGQRRARQGQLHVPVKFLRLARIHERREVLIDFARDLAARVGRVKARDGGNPALPGPLRLREGLRAHPDRRDRPQARDHHPFQS